MWPCTIMHIQLWQKTSLDREERHSRRLRQVVDRVWKPSLFCNRAKACQRIIFRLIFPRMHTRTQAGFPSSIWHHDQAVERPCLGLYLSLRACALRPLPFPDTGMRVPPQLHLVALLI